MECGVGYTNLKFNECIKCDSGCGRCDPKNSKICLQCIKGLELDTNNWSCVINCPQGYFYDNSTNKCNSCIKNCKSCSNNETCTQCKDFFLLSSNNKSCDITCPKNQIDINNKCFDCPITKCNECTYNLLKPNKIDCLSCKDNFKLYKGQCFKDCPYGTKISLDGLTCVSSCSSCSINCRGYSDCLSCRIKERKLFHRRTEKILNLVP